MLVISLLEMRCWIYQDTKLSLILSSIEFSIEKRKTTIRKKLLKEIFHLLCFNQSRITKNSKRKFNINKKCNSSHLTLAIYTISLRQLKMLLRLTKWLKRASSKQVQAVKLLANPSSFKNQRTCLNMFILAIEHLRVNKKGRGLIITQHQLHKAQGKTSLQLQEQKEYFNFQTKIPIKYSNSPQILNLKPLRDLFLQTQNPVQMSNKYSKPKSSQKAP